MNLNDFTDQGRSRTKTSTSTTLDSANTQENPQQQSPDAAKMQENVDVSSIESPPVRFLDLLRCICIDL